MAAGPPPTHPSTPPCPHHHGHSLPGCQWFEFDADRCAFYIQSTDQQSRFRRLLSKHNAQLSEMKFVKKGIMTGTDAVKEIEVYQLFNGGTKVGTAELAQASAVEHLSSRAIERFVLSD
jgi:hypothetical protein